MENNKTEDRERNAYNQAEKVIKIKFDYETSIEYFWETILCI